MFGIDADRERKCRDVDVSNAKAPAKVSMLQGVVSNISNPYWLSLSERERLRFIIRDLTKNNIIQENKSSFASPVILEKKSKMVVIGFVAMSGLSIKTP